MKRSAILACLAMFVLIAPWADAQAVYQSLLHGESRGLFQVFNWDAVRQE